MYRQSEKNLLSSNTSSTCADNMVNLTWPTNGWDWFRSLGHPYKFQRVLRLGSVTAQHLVVGVSQTLRRWQRAPPMFGRATIRLGIGPHSSFHYFPNNFFITCTRFLQSKHQHYTIADRLVQPDEPMHQSVLSNARSPFTKSYWTKHIQFAVLIGNQQLLNYQTFM